MPQLASRGGAPFMESNQFRAFVHGVWRPSVQHDTVNFA